MNDEVMSFSENETDYRVYVNYANRQTDTMDVLGKYGCTNS